MACPPIPHALHAIRRRTHRHIRRHITAYVATTIAAGCVGTPIAVIALAPPTLARPIEAPQSVPEPGAVWVLLPGIIGLGLTRRHKWIAA